MTTIYVITKTIGEYSDKHKHIDGYVQTEQKALEVIESLNKNMAIVTDKYSQFLDDMDQKYPPIEPPDTSVRKWYRTEETSMESHWDAVHKRQKLIDTEREQWKASFTDPAQIKALNDYLNNYYEYIRWDYAKAELYL